MLRLLSFVCACVRAWQANRRLHNYFALTRTFATTTTANEIHKLIDQRKKWARLMEKRALIESRAVGIWMGLTIELAIHIFITLIENTVIEVYATETGSSPTGYLGTYGTIYGDAYDYENAAILRSIVFVVNFAVSAALTGIFYALMYVCACVRPMHTVQCNGGRHCRAFVRSTKVG